MCVCVYIHKRTCTATYIYIYIYIHMYMHIIDILYRCLGTHIGPIAKTPNSNALHPLLSGSSGSSSPVEALEELSLPRLEKGRGTPNPKWVSNTVPTPGPQKYATNCLLGYVPFFWAIVLNTFGVQAGTFKLNSRGLWEAERAGSGNCSCFDGSKI